MIVKSLIGKRVGKLVVVAQAETKNQKKRWLCKCDCGKDTIVITAQLTRSDRPTSSCGCLVGEWQAKNKGSKAPNWKGGYRIDSDGYSLIYDPKHPRSKSNGYVREHIAVMENILGRSLVKGEEVHHKNGIKHDNSPENLELWVRSQPSGQRASDLVKWAKEILERYGKES